MILQAPPGAGKSTVLPLHLLDCPWLAGRKIIMLEPRRLAAKTVAHRLAELHGDRPGETAGFRIRFENNTTAATRIEVVTEGILTRLIQNDNTLDGIGLVIFDEFHERSLQSDLALALCLQVQKILRDDLRILVMSATLDTGSLSTMLGAAPVITSAGRQFAVQHIYHNPDPDAPLPYRMAKTIRKALKEHSGDVLAFLPGAGEISKTQSLLESEPLGAQVVPLYGDLNWKKQQEAILPLPNGNRKVVLATSIAETSLTIEGITIVVDSGFSRIPKFDPRSGLTRLDTIRVTKDSADQRAGRAGRLSPGVCYRLWSEGQTAHLVSHRQPEILEADLAPLMLELRHWGTRNVNELAWITPPPAGAVRQALDLLSQLDALDEGRITERGRKMLKLPTHPRIAHMLLSASPADLGLACDVAALLEERDPLARESGADLTLRLEALIRYRRSRYGDRSFEKIERLSEAWRKQFSVATALDSLPTATEAGKLLTAAYPERVARQTERHSTRYKLANGRIVRLDEHDPLRNFQWISVAHLDAGAGEGKIFLAAPLDEGDLRSLAITHEVVRWDFERGMVVASEEDRIGSVVLASRPMTNVPDEKRVNALCQVVQSEGLHVLGWSPKEDQWQARVMSLRSWRPEDAWPDVSVENLLNTVEAWLPPFLGRAYKRSDLERLPLGDILAAILPWDHGSRLDQLAPPWIEVPSGSKITVEYNSHGDAPALHVRLQEVFGLLATPTVNEGRMPVVMHLLSPGYKPVQVTKDLQSFWSSAYHEVRKELRIRYRKHAWPEDPWTAKAERRPTRRG